MKIKKTVIFILTFIFCACVMQPLFAKDKIIAVVNKEIITEKDLEDFISFARGQFSQELKPQELESKINSMKTDMLKKLIEDRLIVQEAKKFLEEAKKKKDAYAVVRVEPEEGRVKSRIEDVKKKYGSDTEFQNDLALHGLVQADMEKRIREQMLMLSFIDYKIRMQIIVRPEEVTALYNKNPKEFNTPATREFEVITLENKDQATSFAYSLRKGEKLEKLAGRYPVKVDSMRSNNTGELRKEIEDVVFHLEAGGVSDPVTIKGVYYVFRLLSITPSRQQSLLEAQPEIYAYLFDQKMREEMQKWLDETKKKSYIKIY